MNARIVKYGTRNWAVMVGDLLIAVTVYKKGAKNVADILNAIHDNMLAFTLGMTN